MVLRIGERPQAIKKHTYISPPQQRTNLLRCMSRHRSNLVSTVALPKPDTKKTDPNTNRCFATVRFITFLPNDSGNRSIPLR